MKILITILTILLVFLPLSAQTHRKPITPHQVKVKHPGFVSGKPMLCTLNQITDANGYPTGYTMVVDSVICLDQRCKVIKCTMVWDALGKYQRYELLPGKKLSKSPKTAGDESIPFNRKDYRRLDAILSDPYSILKHQTLQSITPAVKGDVDAVTGATPKTLERAVVKGAALTCFNLWHWAHGDVTQIAQELTHQHCDETLLSQFLASEEQHKILFALEHLRLHKIYSPQLFENIKTSIPNGNADISELGLAYLEQASADSALFYDTLAEIFAISKTDIRRHCLDYLKDKEKLPVSLFETLSIHLCDLNTFMEVQQLLTLIEQHSATSEKILTNISELLNSDDFFIARRAYLFLKEQKLNPELQDRVKAFVLKYQDRL